MFDLLITGGTIVDGTGADRFVGDVGIVDGKIAEIAPSIEGEATRTIDATGLLVTPGFVDIHTHYDGQVTWDDTLDPSSGHGVTTVVMGNCGVGFAPVKPDKHQWLIELMEGVEDIPGAALAEGIDWQWETFPEYLDAVEKRTLSVDVATQIAHGAVRAYVMGERGARNEPATPEDIDAMATIVGEAIEAGALGFSTSRTIGHKAIDGEPVPGTFAAEDELFGIGRELGRLGKGLFELAPAGAAGMDLISPPKEMDWMCRLSAEIGRPVTFALTQVDAKPELWRELMDASLAAVETGAQVYPQVAARPFGILGGLQTYHPFTYRPTYAALAHLPLAERHAELSKPEVRETILAEADGELPDEMFAGVHLMMGMAMDRIFPLGDPPNYEPTPEESVAGIAERTGSDPFAVWYDAMLELGGKAMFMLPAFNYSHGNMDALREMLTHPQSVSGLSDGGAHCGMICDASIPTYLMTHWTRDRTRGERLELEWVIKKQSNDTAQLYGLTDRGTLEVGQLADVNIIDYDNLSLRSPELVYDLPAGGRRLLQRADGYRHTIKSGEITRTDGADTGARPGALLRGAR